MPRPAPVTLQYWRIVWRETVHRTWRSIRVTPSAVLKALVVPAVTSIGTYLLLGADDFRKAITIALLGLLGALVSFLLVLIYHAWHVPSELQESCIATGMPSTRQMALASTVVVAFAAIIAFVSCHGSYALASDYALPSASPSPTTPPPTLTPTSSSTATITSTMTRTPTPTETPIPHIPGLDIEDLCVDQINWTPSDGVRFRTDSRGCLNLSSWGIAAAPYGPSAFPSTPAAGQPGLQLDFVNDRSQEVHRGIFFTLPDSGRSHITISFSVNIQSLVGDALQANPNLVFGLGLPEETLERGHFLFFRVVGESPNIYAYSGESIFSPGYCAFYSIRDCLYAAPSDVVFDIDGTAVELQLDHVTQRHFVLYRREGLVFWIGYRLPPGGHIRAFVWNLRIQ